MDEKFRKISNHSETRSPVLLRRRLSAPETIMRKHVLAMQQSESVDGSETLQSDVRYQHDVNIGCSDTNLNKQIKKPTLLKRFWNNSNRQYSYSRFPGTFYEWQYEKLTSGRSTNSLSSIHSSPEHLIKPQNRRSLQSSPQHRKISPKRDFNKNSTPKRKISVYENSYDHNKKVYDTKSTIPSRITTNSEFVNSCTNNNSTPLEIREEIIEESDISSKDLNYNLKPTQYIKYSSNLNNPTVHPIENTNVNVISNVQLSQTTLDLIFNQVIKDVQNTSIPNDHQSTSFYLNNDVSDDSQNSQIVKCMISNVGTGSPYSKNEIPIVPRLSALPRTTSMEVNISSNTPTDKESDTSSLADSLEETIIKTTETINIKHDDYLKSTQNKSTAFFIPIEIENKTEYKSVSEHLPDKLKDRLQKRQQKLGEKMQNRKTSPNSWDNCLNNNTDTNFGINYTKTKKHKPLLPCIKTIRKIKIDDNQNYDKKSKVIKKKTDVYNKTKQFSSNMKVKNDKLSPLCTAKSELLCNEEGARKFCHKTEFNNSNKRIEILEIMECIETPNKRNISKNKSKIPVLINRLPKIDNNKIKPTYLDLNYDNTDDPKLDRLIANILIDTLNNDEHSKYEKKTTKPSPKYQQKFEPIPEELTLQSSINNNNNQNNNNNNNNNNLNDNDATFLDEASGMYKGKAAIAVVKDDNIASIPKGWITFYMLHKNHGSPDSTSDEGKDNATNSIKTMQINNNDNKLNKSLNINDNIEMKSLNCDNVGNSTRHRYKYRNTDNNYQQLGEWSVTISGTNHYGQFVPNLEMCLKFPDINKNFLINKSEISDNNPIRFPKIEVKNKNDKITTDDVSHHHQHLPELYPDRSTPKLKINSVSSKFEPKQTRTSLRRYNLTRPKFHYHHISDL